MLMKVIVCFWCSRVLSNKTGVAYAPNPSEPSKLLVKFDIPRKCRFLGFSLHCAHTSDYSSNRTGKLLGNWHRLFNLQRCKWPLQKILECGDKQWKRFQVFGCHNIAGGLVHDVFSWILSRTSAGFSNDEEAIISAVLARSNVDATLYVPMVQKNCVNYWAN